MLKYLDDALKELDSLDSVISSYKIHLNVGICAYLPTTNPNNTRNRLSVKISRTFNLKIVVCRFRLRTRGLCLANLKSCLYVYKHYSFM